MTNEERKAALNLARRKSLEYAQAAETTGGLDTIAMAMSTIWSDVAQAMKDGDPKHDAPDGEPIHNPFKEYLTR